MRLGYYDVAKAASLDGMADKLDVYGLSAVWANVVNNSDDECLALGERASQLGIVFARRGVVFVKRPEGSCGVGTAVLHAGATPAR